MSSGLTLEEYGPLLGAAFATLHGGHPDEPSEPEAMRPQESLAAFLARTRAQALERLLAQAKAAGPPPGLEAVHDALVPLLEAALEADKALQEQVEAYNRGDSEASLRQAERVGQLVAASARLDRDLILALEAAEEAEPGTLAALGLAELLR